MNVIWNNKYDCRYELIGKPKIVPLILGKSHLYLAVGTDFVQGQWLNQNQGGNLDFVEAQGGLEIRIQGSSSQLQGLEL